MKHRVEIWLVLAGAWLAPLVAAQEMRRFDLTPPYLEPIEPIFTRACIGPDQRIWLANGASPEGQRDLETLKKSIEVQFKEKSPRILGADILLFEPGGRVWFLKRGMGTASDVLLGYNGKDWAQWSGKEGERLKLGYSAAIGMGSYWQGPPAFAGGTAFFFCGKGILTFDGRQWSEQLVKPTQAWHAAILEPESDGKGLVAMVGGPDVSVWRWREGAWTLLLQWESERNRIREIVHYDGQFLVTCGRGRLIRFGLNDPPPPDFEAKLAAVRAAAQGQERENAMFALAAGGPGLLPRLAMATAAARDEQDKALLSACADRVFVPNEGNCQLGEYSAATVSTISKDAQGMMYFACTRIEGKGGRADRGVLFGKSLESLKLIPGPDAWTQMNANGAGSLVPHLYPDGKSILITSGFKGARIDMETGKIMREFGGGITFQCIAPDGTAYATLQQRNGKLAVHRLRDERAETPIKLEQFPMKYGSPFLAPDGSVWHVWGVGDVQKYDGNKWEAIPALRKRDMPWGYLAGNHGEIFVATRNQAMLFTSDGAVQEAISLKELVRKNRDLVKRAFPRAYGPIEARFSIRVDKSGNIWLQEPEDLKVLVGDRWIEGLPPRDRPPGQTPSVVAVTPVGDGSRMLLVTGGYRQLNLAEVTDGAVTFTPLPGSFEGGFAAEDGSAYVDLGSSSGRPMARITELGIIKEFPLTKPLCLEPGGTLWVMVKDARDRTGVLRLIRDGRDLGVVEAPAFNAKLMASDAAGSVYVAGVDALLHLVRRGDEKTIRYVVAESFKVAPTGAFSPRRLQLSRGKWVLLEMQRSVEPLVMIRLPQSPTPAAQPQALP